MPEIAVKDINNKDTGTVKLNDERFGSEGKEALLHSAVVNHLANQRQGTHSTKGRSDVRGGGAKPYRQKGTGRARAGTNTSPIWRGGGTVFGPKPRDYYYRMPRKARRLAFYAAMSSKLGDGEVIVVDTLKVATPKTKEMVKILGNLGIGEGSLLIVLNEMDGNVALSSRNLPGVRLKLAADLNAYDVLSHRKLLMTKEALVSLEGGEQ